MQDDAKRSAYKNAQYGPPVLRLALGVMFIISGTLKLLNPSQTAEFLANIGFFGAVFWAGLLLASELVFGIAVLLGWQVKWTVWPLVIVLAVATFTVVLPNTNASNIITLLFHVLGIAALVSLFLTGPGALAVGRRAPETEAAKLVKEEPKD